ncbi:hypothetical protein [Nocardia nova]|uniref:hypothetical protein n=1 Tax=Nocardia nova TaxID=37330 RepID=UPI0011B09134|nr:hypothetical protein [Nocardia nova]
MDRARVAADELRPILVLLDPVENEAQRIRRDADTRAAQRRRDGDLRADRMVAGARDSVETVAVQEMSRCLADAVDAGDDAELVARRTDEHVAQRLPGYVDRVVQAARTLIAEWGGRDFEAVR